jgi:hypothetical protein
MPKKRNPWFRIHRVDAPSLDEGQAPDAHYRAFWRIAETTYRVHVWTQEELERKPETEVPAQAQQVDGRGWMLLQPLDAK